MNLRNDKLYLFWGLMKTGNTSLINNEDTNMLMQSWCEIRFNWTPWWLVDDQSIPLFKNKHKLNKIKQRNKTKRSNRRKPKNILHSITEHKHQIVTITKRSSCTSCIKELNQVYRGHYNFKFHSLTLSVWQDTSPWKLANAAA